MPNIFETVLPNVLADLEWPHELPQQPQVLSYQTRQYLWAETFKVVGKLFGEVHNPIQTFTELARLTIRVAILNGAYDSWIAFEDPTPSASPIDLSKETPITSMGHMLHLVMIHDNANPDVLFELIKFYGSQIAMLGGKLSEELV